jgi:hypothetical protein
MHEIRVSSTVISYIPESEKRIQIQNLNLQEEEEEELLEILFSC